MTRFLAFTFLMATTMAFAAATATATVSPLEPEALVAEVVATHPELRYYEAELAAARATARGAGAWSDPELSVEVGQKRVRDAGGRLAGEGVAWSVSVSQTFEWGGRMALRKAIANRDVELAEIGLARFESALAARVRTLAYGLHAEAVKAEAVAEVAVRFAELKEGFLARDPAGVTPLLETRVIEAQELVLQRRATEAELALKAAAVELNQLRGRALTEPVRVTATRVELGEAPGREALLAAARKNFFDYRARRIEVERQADEVRLARGERYPSVTVTPFVEEARAGERERVIGVGVSLPLPLTTRTRSGVEAAVARRRQAEAALRMAELELEREVVMAAETFETKRAEAARWAEDSVARFREAAALADEHYRLGAVPLGTYVELQTSYLEALEALLDTRREAMEAGLRLQQIGGVEFGAVKFLKP